MRPPTSAMRRRLGWAREQTVRLGSNAPRAFDLAHASDQWGL